MRLRIQFEKSGALRFTSHKDVVRLFQRCFAATGVPVSFSQGFHPHMRMSFGSPLKTGWESREEYLDVDLDRPFAGFEDTCNGHLPEGLRTIAAVEVDLGVKKLASDICVSRFEVRVHVENIYSQSKRTDDDRLRRLETDLQGVVDRIAKDADPESARVIEFTVTQEDDFVVINYLTTAVSGKIVSPVLLVSETIGDPDEFRVAPKVTRLAQFVERDGALVSPLSKGVVQNKI